MEPDAQQDLLAAEPKPKLSQRATELFKSVILFLLFFFAIKAYVIEGYEVQGTSMEPTLHDKDRVLVFKLSQSLQSLPFMSAFNTLDSGDIVVFNSQDAHNSNYIKRVIAYSPGENENNVVAASVKNPTPQSTQNVLKVSFAGEDVIVGQSKLDQGYLADAERHGQKQNISTYLKSGQLYVMGDHRSVSKDSRSFGPIHQKQVVGSAVFRIWPLDRAGWL